MPTTAAGTRRGNVSDRGSVTAEFAIVLPAVVVTIVLVLTVLSVGITRLQCTEAARAATHAAVVGADGDRVLEIGRRVAGGGSSVHITNEDGWATVTVTRRVDFFVFDGPWRVEAAFSSPIEPIGRVP